MPVSHDLQNVIGDVSAAIAANQTWSRVKLEKLRRSLNEAARAAAQAERSASHERFALTELIAGVTTGAADIAGLARRADAVVGTGAGR